MLCEELFVDNAFSVDGVEIQKVLIDLLLVVEGADVAVGASENMQGGGATRQVLLVCSADARLSLVLV